MKDKVSGHQLRTSLVFCVVCCFPGASATVAAAFAPVSGTAPAASSSEHSFLTAGCCNDAASSRGLFLGVPSLDACLRGEGLARRERLRLASRLAFFRGLAPGAGDLGDIWTLASSEPRTRRLVGVAVALILERGRFGGCLWETRLGKWIFATARRAGAAMGAWQGGLRASRVGRGTHSQEEKASGWVMIEEMQQLTRREGDTVIKKRRRKAKTCLDVFVAVCCSNIGSAEEQDVDLWRQMLSCLN